MFCPKLGPIFSKPPKAKADKAASTTTLPETAHMMGSPHSHGVFRNLNSAKSRLISVSTMGYA